MGRPLQSTEQSMGLPSFQTYNTKRTRDHSNHNESEDDEYADDVGLGEELHELRADVAARLFVPAELAVLHTVAPEACADAGGVLAVVFSLAEGE